MPKRITPGKDQVVEVEVNLEEVVVVVCPLVLKCAAAFIAAVTALLCLSLC